MAENSGQQQVQRDSSTPDEQKAKARSWGKGLKMDSKLFNEIVALLGLNDAQRQEAQGCGCFDFLDK